MPLDLESFIASAKDVIKTATSDIPYERYVSHTVFIGGFEQKKEQYYLPKFTSSNHGFYLGKMFRKPGKDKIYDIDLIDGFLHELVSRIEEGEKCRIVVGRVVSEICNGSEDLKGTYETKEEIQLIQNRAKLVGRQHSRGPYEVEVIDLESLPEHRELFTALRSSEIEKALNTEGDIPLDSPATSLQIAQLLYKAQKENQNLAGKFKYGIPKKLKQDSYENSNKQYYALLECAIRVSDVLRGRYIHGGANRQAIYDNVITEMMRGKNGYFKSIRELWPLFEQLKGIRFETVHIIPEKNPVKLEHKKTSAVRKLMAATALAVTAVLGPCAADIVMESREQQAKDKKMDDYITAELGEITFCSRMDSRTITHPKDKNLEIFHELIGKLMREIKIRYGLENIEPNKKPKISYAVERLLRAAVIKFALEKKDILSVINNDRPLLVYYADLFVQQNAPLFIDNGVNITIPYKELLPYKDAMRDLAEHDQNVEMRFTYSNGRPNPYGTEIDHSPDLKFIGRFRSSKEYIVEDYQLYAAIKDGQSYIVGREPEKWKQNGAVEYVYTSQKAKQAAQEYVEMMRAYEIVHLDQFRTAFFHTCHWVKLPGLKKDADNYNRGRSKSFKDPFGEYEFEVLEDTYIDDNNTVTAPIIFARRPGEGYYTAAIGQEAAKVYCNNGVVKVQ